MNVTYKGLGLLLVEERDSWLVRHSVHETIFSLGCKNLDGRRGGLVFHAVKAYWYLWVSM